jgi:hypothetical protein
MDDECAQSAARYGIVLEASLITGIDPQILEFAAAAEITIQGASLNAANVSVKISGLDSPSVKAVTDVELTAQLPAAVLAGVQTVQVVHPPDLGTDQEPHKGFQSNVGVFMLTPKIGTITYSPNPVPTVTVTVQPSIGPQQRVDLTLNSLPGAPQQAFSFSSMARAAATTSIALPIAGVPAGTYIVRLSVDGAATALTVDAAKKFNGPTVTVT